MNDNLVVDTEGIREVANELNANKEEMLQLFKTKVLPMLSNSKEYLQTSGLDYDAIINAFQEVFGNIDTKVDAISSTLTNKVIPEYEEASSAVTEMFNGQFASDMSELLASLKR